MEQLGSALIVIVSDAHALSDVEHQNDINGKVQALLYGLGFVIDGSVLCSAESLEVRNAFNTAVIGGVDLVLSIGGVGIKPRDIVPNITESLLDTRLLGIEEALRRAGLESGCIEAAMSRGVVGISGSTIIVNLIDSEGAIAESLQILKPFLIKLLQEFSNI